MRLLWLAFCHPLLVGTGVLDGPRIKLKVIMEKIISKVT